MIRLILVRHGNTFLSDQTPTQVGARTDLPLTQEGRAQAARMGQFLAGESAIPQAIYAGALQRQTETAAILSQSLGGLSILPEKALTEIDYGLWEGLVSEQIQAGWKREYDAWTTEGKWPVEIFGGSLERHLSSIRHWLDGLCKTFASGDVIVGVTSNGIIRLFHPQRQEKRDLKVKTGHFCELLLSPNSIEIQSWNRSC